MPGKYEYLYEHDSEDGESDKEWLGFVPLSCGSCGGECDHSKRTEQDSRTEPVADEDTGFEDPKDYKTGFEQAEEDDQLASEIESEDDSEDSSVLPVDEMIDLLESDYDTSVQEDISDRDEISDEDNASDEEMSDYSSDASIFLNPNNHSQPRQSPKAVSNTAVRIPAKEASWQQKRGLASTRATKISRTGSKGMIVKPMRAPAIANQGGIIGYFGQRFDDSSRPIILQPRHAAGENQAPKPRVSDAAQARSSLLPCAALDVPGDTSQELLDYLAAVDAITQKPQPVLPPYLRSHEADAATRPFIQRGSNEHDLLISISQLVHTCKDGDLDTQEKLLRQIIAFK